MQTRLRGYAIEAALEHKSGWMASQRRPFQETEPLFTFF